jgi:hypothetical protein
MGSDPSQINPELLSRFSAMAAAARAAGHNIGIGSGYRTVDEQIRLRKSNGCPDVWTSPASSCRVPTAIPGRSNHNHGLAIDFTGDSAADRWVAENMGRWGLHLPVPGENWHLEMIDDDGAHGHMQGAQEMGAVGFNLQWQEETGSPEDQLVQRLETIRNLITGAADTGGEELAEAPDFADQTTQEGTGSEMVQAPDIEGGTPVPAQRPLPEAPLVAPQQATPGGGGSASGDRLGNARIIAQVGREMGAPAEAIQIALAAALVESNLVNVNYGDRDSLGLFQQRPSQGWGTPAQVTDPRYAATQFFSRLLGMNWQSMDPGAAAQAVQRSAFPERYGQRYGEAVSIYGQLGS